MAEALHPSLAGPSVLLLRCLAAGLKSLVTIAAAFPSTVTFSGVEGGDVSFLKETTYDFVAIDGGPLGLVVAHRISEDESRKFQQ
ncbi:hypothetical protein C7974DRAFT_168062 [Boeremia exigua]|uniref:uncharacterized protein n=1 Tax=Boeremia exigua TaxID=749465 RepID=UPI001E8D30C2|nr:uncharacterized protein C7974DRAFT_168062 [Boeremia exigua]KAH6633243.1 hypothetical protein C7974DRAFT_168062 [Boeremia exigua]